MKRRNRLSLTFISAFVVSALCAAVPAGLPAAYAADTQDAVQLPDWIPDSYGKALQFVNTYGGTHIEDGLLCVVFCENEVRAPGLASPQYEMTVSGDALQPVSREFYPVPDNGAYYVMDLEVIVYQPVSSGDFQVSLSAPESDTLYDYERDPYIPDYRFSVDEDLVITETDPFGWAPDCYTEFQDFLSQHGPFTANGNLIVACLNPSLTVTESYVEEISSDAVRRIGIWGCSEREPTNTGRTGPAWHTKTQVALYEAVSDGIVDISWQVRDSLEETTQSPVQGLDRSQLITDQFLITDHAQTVLGSSDAKITLLNDQSGEPVTVTPRSGFALYQIVNSPYAKPLIERLRSNPAIVRDLGKMIGNEQPSLDTVPFALAVPAGYAFAEERGTITKLANGACDICYRLKCDPAGDIDRNGVSDKRNAEALLRWLTCVPESQDLDWQAADCDQDGMLTAIDLTLLKMKLLDPDTPAETDVITAATRLPVIVDEYGAITDSMKEKLYEAVKTAYPGSDLSDFKLVYAPDHPLTKQAGGTCFYVYYQDTLVHGVGDLDLINNVYAAVTEDGKATVQLLSLPEAFLSLDLSGEDVSEAMMQNRYKGCSVDRIIYAQILDQRVKPIQVAYRVINPDFRTEDIYAENGSRLISIQLPSP